MTVRFCSIRARMAAQYSGQAVSRYPISSMVTHSPAACAQSCSISTPQVRKLSVRDACGFPGPAVPDHTGQSARSVLSPVAQIHSTVRHRQVVNAGTCPSSGRSLFSNVDLPLPRSPVKIRWRLPLIRKELQIQSAVGLNAGVPVLFIAVQPLPSLLGQPTAAAGPSARRPCRQQASQ